MVGMTKKDLINARSNSINVKEHLDKALEITGACVIEKAEVDEMGEIIAVSKVGYLKTNVGIFGFTSATLIECISDVEDMLTDEPETAIPFHFVARQSKNGRTFYTLNLD